MTEMIAVEPEWITELRQMCLEASQQKIAKAMGYSASTINQILQGSYGAKRLAGVEKAFNGAFKSRQVSCPILGDIGAQDCRRYQRRPYVNSNYHRARLYKACKSCPNNNSGE